MPVLFTDKAMTEYAEYFSYKRTLERIRKLLEDIRRNGPLVGIGKPEALKYNYAGSYSREIDEKNRLVYRGWP